MIRYKVILSLCVLLLGPVYQSFSAASPRILNAIGISGGVTFSKQKWTASDPLYGNPNKFILGYNGSVLAELFARDYTSIISELQFNQKGTNGKDTSGNKYSDKVNYLCFNNFYKIRYEMDAIIPYILMGPRIEYALSQSTAGAPIIKEFRKVHLTASIGAGVEFVSYGNLKFFTEVHYNPDVMRSYRADKVLDIRTTAFELRVGLKYVFADKKYACPPVYK